MQFIKGGFSFRLHARGPVWQVSFRNHRVRDCEDFQKHRGYIWLNPVRARLVANAEEYPYSSAAGRLTLDPAPQGLKPRSFEEALTRRYSAALPRLICHGRSDSRGARLDHFLAAFHGFTGWTPTGAGAEVESAPSAFFGGGFLAASARLRSWWRRSWNCWSEACFFIPQSCHRLVQGGWPSFAFL
jgi:hypothetical protein